MTVDGLAKIELHVHLEGTATPELVQRLAARNCIGLPERLLNEHREHEKNLRATLTTAQQVSDDIKASAQREAERIENNAHKEAERIVREAEGRSQILLDKTQARLEDIQREIDGLKLKRREVEASLESTIQALRNTLEYVRELENRERDEKILLHRPRFEQPAEVRDSIEPRTARM